MLDHLAMGLHDYLSELAGSIQEIKTHPHGWQEKTTAPLAEETSVLPVEEEKDNVSENGLVQVYEGGEESRQITSNNGDEICQ